MKMWKTSLPENLRLKETSSDEIDAGRLRHSPFLSKTVVDWWVRDFMKPIEDFCVSHKITPNALTTTGLILTIIAAILLGAGHLIWGGWMVIVAGCFDFFDGRVARRMNMTTLSGSFYDSVLDRYMDFATLLGLAFYFRNSWFLSVVYLSILGSATTPYIRAKAESLGLKSAEGNMQRPERIVYIGLGAALSGYMMILFYPFHERGYEYPPYILYFSLSVVAIMSNRVAIQRFRSVYLSLKSKES